MYVIGTAGHVDHGKSTLIKALTGIDPDRLAEEKEREMTIDLGFAWLQLPSGREVSVIDVPGHEHFIKNMLTGVSGMDLALLIVSAAESIKPQTREHLAILDLMEVPGLVAVITQSDLADEDQIALVEMEIEDLLLTTRFKGSPAAAVSAVSGTGLEELKEVIDNTLNNIQPRKNLDRPRLPIDRIFTISGSGTVITGTLIDGTMKSGQEVEIQPENVRARVRGLQTHKTQLNSAAPGNRVAVNLAGLSTAAIKRGSVLTSPGWLKPSKLIDAKLNVLKDLNRPLRHNTEISLHAGSAEVMARVRMLEKEEAAPGDTTWVQFILSEPLAVVNGDHYIIRSPNDTLGGGIFIDTHPEKRHKRFRPETIEYLMLRAEGKAEETLLAALKNKQPQEISALISGSSLPSDILESGVLSLIQQGLVTAVGQGKRSLLFTADFWRQQTDSILQMTTEFHRKYPLRAGIPRAEIISKLKLGSRSQEVLQKLTGEGILVEESAAVRMPDHTIKLTKEQQAKIDGYVRQLESNPYSPSPETALEPDLLNLLIDRGNVVKTSAGVIFAASAWDEMTAKIMEHLKNTGKITLAEMRDMFGSSRKYAQAVLEYMDEKKLTKRVGDDRVAGEKAAQENSTQLY